MGKTIAIIIARLIFAGVFLMAATFKFLGMAPTADWISCGRVPPAADASLDCRAV